MPPLVRERQELLRQIWEFFLKTGPILGSSCTATAPERTGLLHIHRISSPGYGSFTQVSVSLLGIGSITRYVGYFTYEKPPLPTIQLQHGNFYISQEVHPVIQLTPEYSPLPGEKYASVLVCSPSAVINTADYVPQVLAQGYAPFFFTATATNLSGFATDTTTMMLLGLHHFALTPNPQSVEHGQTVNFYVQAQDIYNNLIDNFYNPVYSTDYPYDIPLTISWSPDSLGEVILAQGGASVAARSMDHLSKGESVHKLQPLDKFSVIGQKKYAIKILNNEVSKNAAVNFPKSSTKTMQATSQTGTSFLNSTYGDASALEFVADGKLSALPDTVTITVTSMDGSSKTGTGMVIVSSPQANLEVKFSEDDQFISGDDLPKMPDLTTKIKAQLPYIKTIPVQYKWEITIKWLSDKDGWTTPQNDEKYKGEADGQTNKWTDLNVDLKAYIRGGQTVTLHVEAVTAENSGVKDFDKTFNIKGKNPEVATVLAELKNHTSATVDQYAAVAWQESSFRQFNINKGDKGGYPLQGGSDFNDFGFMGIRLAGHPTWDYSYDDLIWNWVANVQQGQVYFDKCIAKAENYQNRSDFSKYDPQPTALENNQESTEPIHNQVFLQSYCYYNGGFGKSGNSPRYWRWSPANTLLAVFGEAGHWTKETEHWKTVVGNADNVWKWFNSKPWLKK